MADTKISALTSGNPAQSTDEIPIARSGANFKITAGSIAALGGDVDGPASSVDNQIALFDSTSGKLIKAASTTGLLKASSGVIAAATSGTDYAPATSGTSILKGSGTGGFSNASAGSDYLAPPSGTALLKANSGGALANAVAGTDYAAATTGTNAQLLANNGSGGFSNITVGSNLTLSAGTLSATGGLAWQSVQTTGFTAVAGRAYPCNTTSAAFTVTLPASPSAGDQILLTDYAGTWDTNFLTVNPNGLKIYGSTDNQVIPNERGAVTLVYVDTTQGWITASGMTQSPFAAPPPTVELLVVAGSGGSGNSFGSGSGAGGYRASSSFSVSGNTSYTLTVGAGGAKSTSAYSAGSQGSSSVFSSITSAGGGGGGSNGYYSGGAGGNGGSGGGGGGAPSDRPGTYLGGTGNTPSVTPAQGFNGGNGNAGAAGGSGGSGSAGGNCAGANSTGGSAGNGTSNSITGVATYYAAGVAGFGTPNGSAGSQGGIAYGSAGAENSGSGASEAYNGASGVVVIAYPSSYRNLASISAGLTYTLDTSTRSGYKVYKFTAGTGTVSW